MSNTYQRIVLASRPEGAVTPDNFRLETAQIPELQDGQVLVRNHFLSLDPYMRGRMNDSKSYAQPQPLGEVMIGGTVGVVEASRNPAYAVGDNVVGMFGWQEVGISDGRGMQKVDTRHVPLSAYLGSVGMPGVTAWYGLNRIMHPKPGQTVAVSAASGAVGSVVGQLAKLKGCRAVGFAGGRTSATTWSMSWASTPASTTRPPRTRRNCTRCSRRPRRMASMPISRTSAATSWTPCCAA